MDNILERLLTLVEKGTVEHRCAGLLVLGALKLENARVVKTVTAVLAQPNPVLKDFALRYFEEMTMEEVAERMEVSLSTAKRLMSRSTTEVAAAIATDADLRGFFAAGKGEGGARP